MRSFNKPEIRSGKCKQQFFIVIYEETGVDHGIPSKMLGGRRDRCAVVGHGNRPRIHRLESIVTAIAFDQSSLPKTRIWAMAKQVAKKQNCR